MDKQPVFFCVCSQKGGVGKSTFTILLASWLHYALGRDVLVVDCDAPQWSIVAQRERELDVLERNDQHIAPQSIVQPACEQNREGRFSYTALL